MSSDLNHLGTRSQEKERERKEEATTTMKEIADKDQNGGFSTLNAEHSPSESNSSENDNIFQLDD